MLNILALYPTFWPPGCTFYCLYLGEINQYNHTTLIDVPKKRGICFLFNFRMSVALEFTHINFTTETLDNRKTVIQTLTNQIRLVLSEGVGIENVWLTLVKYYIL